MKFERVGLEQAPGSVLGHNIYDAAGRRVLRKGKALAGGDVETLAGLGRRSVYVARLEDGDVEEDEAARRLAAAAAGAGLRRSPARTGRVNLYADVRGVLRLHRRRLERLNVLPGVALAVLPESSAVPEGKMVATLKIIPYALPEATVRRGEAIAGDDDAGAHRSADILHLSELEPRRAGLILSGSPSARERVERGFRTALDARLGALGARLEAVDFVSLDDEAGEERLTVAVGTLLDRGLDLLILAGETAIMDRCDVAPRAIERAGGTIECYGAPVDPGNLLLLAYRGAVPILGAPGCVRSPKTNIVDLVLPRLLVGDRVTAADVAALGHGGLLEDVPERPQPRSWLT
jgi:molybdenum cofactor cytidylyltransferase